MQSERTSISKDRNDKTAIHEVVKDALGNAFLGELEQAGDVILVGGCLRGLNPTVLP